MKNHFCQLFTFLMLASATAQATPYIDRFVGPFLSDSTHESNETINVIIGFKGQNTAIASNDRSQNEQNFIKINRHLIQIILNPLATSREAVKAMNIQPLWIANASVARVTRSQLQSLAKNASVTSIVWADRLITFKNPPVKSDNLKLSEFTYGLQKLRIPELRSKYPNLLGKGIRIGVVDTGIDANHTNLKGRLALFKDFSPKPSATPVDRFGHGTHVSGTIAGSAFEGLEFGIAPQAELIVARIFDDEVNSTVEGIIKALQWMADPDENPKTNDYPVAVNNSWGDDEPYTDRDPQDEPFCATVTTLSQLGIAPIFSAGNSGPNDGTIGLPAGCPDAISIGATDQNDRSPRFSSSGPAKWKTLSLVKPELSAPGVDIFSTTPRNDHESMSGTSMSSPHVTGAYALLLQAHPNLSVNEAIKALTDGSKDLGNKGKDNTFGFGRIDILKSIELVP